MSLEVSDKIALVKTLFPDGSLDLVEITNSGLSDELRRVFAPDFEVEFVPNTPDAERTELRGEAGLREGWRDWLEPWETYRGEVEEVMGAGDDVIVTARVEARARRGGVRFEHPAAVVLTVEDGRVSRIRFYLDRADAFRDAGEASSPVEPRRPA
jgi:ketosteroid isomerase-like protein